MATEKNKRGTEFSSEQVVAKGKELLREGNSRRLVIKTADNKTMLEVNVTIAAIVLLFCLFFPVTYPFLLLAVVAGLFAKVRVQMIHELSDSDQNTIEGEVIDKE